MIKRLLKLVSSNWDKKTMLLVSEDFRKIGTYILGIAFVAMFVQNDNIPLLLAIIIMIFGGIAWFCGVLLAKYCNNLMETDGALRMNITLNWNGFLFAIVFVLFFMGTVAFIGVRSLKRQQEQKAQSKKTHSIGVNS